MSGLAEPSLDTPANKPPYNKSPYILGSCQSIGPGEDRRFPDGGPAASNRTDVAMVGAGENGVAAVEEHPSAARLALLLRQQRLIMATASAVAVAVDLDGVMRALIGGVRALTGAGAGSVRLRTSEPEAATVAYHVYRWQGDQWSERDEQHDGPGGDTARLGGSARGEYVADLAAAGAAGDAAALRAFQDLGVQSSLKVPFRSGGRVVGVLYADADHAYAFDEGLLAPLQLLADHAGTAVEHARLLEAERARVAAHEEAVQGRLRAEAQFRTLLETAPDAVITAAADGRITLINRRVEELFGYAKAELLDSPWTMLMPERCWTVHADSIRLAASGDRAELGGATVELLGRRKDGSEFPFDLSVAVWEAGDATFYTGIMRDMSTRKRAEAALEWQFQEAESARRESRAILDATGEAMLLLSPEGRIINVNRRFTEFFVLEPDAVLGMRLGDVQGELERIFGGPSGYERLVGALDRHAAAETIELQQQWPGQRELQVYSTAVHGADRAAIGRLFVFRDVTKEREADRMKTEFVSLVSHELRTPLTSIKGYIDLLAAGEVGELTPDQLEFLGIAKSNADRLVALINDLLDISRIEAGKVELRRQPLALDGVLQQVATSLRPQLEAKQQKLSLELAPGLPAVLGDGDRLVQVFTNLLSNATKYTPAGGAILLRAGVHYESVQVDVVDTGIGMTLEEIQQLFTKFFRSANPLVREAGGTGLGLSITRSLVELHGGQIQVTSTPGQGATFSVRLPIGDLAFLLPAANPRPERSVLGGRVLVVDDERDIAQLIRRYLEHGGYEVAIAHSGSDAWRLVREQPPDLITLDINLPDVDGFTVLEWLKQDPATAAIPVVFLSINSDEGRGIHLGAIDYLTKPVQEEVLLARVTRALTDGRSRVIIVADDDEATRSLIARHLRRAGYEVREAGDGQKALDLAKSDHPDLILLDIRMPGVDGLTALRALRADDATHELPVVLMTACPGLLEEHRATIEALGGLALAGKPCTPAELSEVLGYRLTRVTAR